MPACYLVCVGRTACAESRYNADTLPDVGHRLLRVLRFGKAARFSPAFHALLQLLVNTFDHVCPIAFLLLLCMFIFAALGMSLFYEVKVLYNPYTRMNL